MKFYLFEEGRNPSSDYYILPLLNSKSFKVKRIDIRSGIFPELEDGGYVFLVRYANRKLLKFLRERRKKIKRLIYFMDDGLWDLKSIRSVPLHYGLRLFRKAYMHKEAILKLGAEIWVSTEYLKSKYSKYDPRLVYPYPLGLESPALSESSQKVLFYHGTSSHSEELDWLEEFFRKVSERHPDTLLEIVLDQKHWNKFKGIRNLIALRPMGWETFYGFSQLKYRTVGLAPLFDTEFNRGRSWIKFYDITRSGAVGIYSEHAPYASYIKEFRSGYVLPMDIKVWLEAVDELLNNKQRRIELFEGAKILVEHFRKLSQGGNML